jgi:hypothetical protein
VPTDTEEKSVPQVLTELKDMTVTYAKQETIDPLRNTGRYVGFGVAGTIALSIGIVLLSLGVLRFLQTETDDTFAGDWSWVPYLITVVPLGLMAALAVRAIQEKHDDGR